MNSPLTWTFLKLSNAHVLLSKIWLGESVLIAVVSILCGAALALNYVNVAKSFGRFLMIQYEIVLIVAGLDIIAMYFGTKKEKERQNHGKR